jgi:ABC-type phosphate/phosphonate transport system substrate-binding protein
MDRRQLLKQARFILGFATGTTQASTLGQSVHIGVVPHISVRTIVEQYQPLQSYLTTNLVADVKISSATTWQSFYRNTQENLYDLIVAPAHLARLMQVDLGMIPIASCHPNIKGILITPKSQGIHSPTEVRSRFVVTGNPAALVTLEGEQWLETAHSMKKGTDYRCVSVRGDDSVGLAVLRGEASVGMMCLHDFEAYPTQIKAQLEIISTYAEFPNFVILANPKKRAFSDAFFENQLLAFSKSDASRQFATTFEQRTGFKIVTKPETNELKKLDKYAAQIRHLLA